MSHYQDWLNEQLEVVTQENRELNFAFTQSQTRFRALLDQMLSIAEAKNNRNPVDQGIRHMLLNLIENFDK